MNPLRPLMLGLTAAIATSLLLALPIAFPPAAPGDLIDWWDVHGTPSATVALFRLGMLACTIWVSFAGVLTALAAALSVRPPKTMMRALPAVMRRWLAGAAVAGIVAAPTAASAAAPVEAAPAAEPAELAEDDGPGGFVLVDRGSAAGSITIAEIDPMRPAGSGPSLRAGSEDRIAAQAAAGTAADAAFTEADTDRSAAVGPAHARIADSTDAIRPPPGPTVSRQAAPGADETDVWTVQQGDHLWAIADATVTSRTGKTDTVETWRYWRSLIAANESVVGRDPDLIHPGTRISLPPL